MKTRPRLRTVLILINLVILALPLGGIAVLRIYESALIRQTESELLAQGAFISKSYQVALERRLRELGRRAPREYGLPYAASPGLRPENGPWQPRFATLDLALDPVYDAPPPGTPAALPADALAGKIGEELQPVLLQVQQQTLAGFAITDAQGVVVAATNIERGVSIANHDEVQLALKGAIETRMRRRVPTSKPPPLDSISRGARIRVFVAMPVIHRERVVGTVMLVRTPGNIKEALRGKQRELLQGGGILLALAALLTLVSSLTISRPVQKLIEQARRAQRGEQNAVIPLAHPGTHEIQALSQTVAEMAQTLEARARYIRDMAAHVSHEFKTPLTSMQGAVELLRDHGESMSGTEREKFLGMLSGEARRLENLVQRLLELARADMMKVGTERSDAGTVLEGTAQRYRELGLPVTTPGLTTPAHVAMAGEVLDSIVSNLLDNARQHAGASVQVQLGWAAQDGFLEITVADTGSGISAANAARIFEPFFTTARKQGNTGLGLAIIQSLLRAHGGEITLLPSTEGARFRIRLPLA